MTVVFQGQLQRAADSPSIEIALGEGESAAALLKRLVPTLASEAKRLLIDETSEELRRTLFIAIDNVHLRDWDAPLPEEARELLVMPPVAGG